MLKIDLEPGESVRIGTHAIVTLEQKSGQRARLSFDADRSIPINKVSRGSSDASLVASHGITGEDAA